VIIRFAQDGAGNAWAFSLRDKSSGSCDKSTLFELFPELRELAMEVGNLIFEGGEFVFEMSDAIRAGRMSSGGRRSRH